MKQEYINALRKIRNLSNRLFNETDALMEKMALKSLLDNN